jgi:hypothetical protein
MEKVGLLCEHVNLLLAMTLLVELDASIHVFVPHLSMCC